MFYVIKYYQRNKETGVYELQYEHYDKLLDALEAVKICERSDITVFISLKKVG